MKRRTSFRNCFLFSLWFLFLYLTFFISFFLGLEGLSLPRIATLLISALASTLCLSFLIYKLRMVSL